MAWRNHLFSLLRWVSMLMPHCHACCWPDWAPVWVLAQLIRQLRQL
jgi:hypothetical protein